jgi:hypothetical protein
MWNSSYFCNSYFTRFYWEKSGKGGFIPPSPPGGSGTGAYLLLLIGVSMIAGLCVTSLLWAAP